MERKRGSKREWTLLRVEGTGRRDRVYMSCVLKERNFVMCAKSEKENINFLSLVDLASAQPPLFRGPSFCAMNPIRIPCNGGSVAMNFIKKGLKSKLAEGFKI